MPACFLPASMAVQVKLPRVSPSPSSSGSLPVINLGRLSEGPDMRALAIQDIARACRDQGCFQVVNHGVSKSIMTGALEAASEFFELAPEHKELFASTDIGRPIRYDTSSRDGISKARSFLKHYANPLEDWVQYWPVHPPSYRKKMGEYTVEIQRVSMQLMDAILQGLGLRPLYMQEKLEKGVQFLALNNYPQFSQLGDKVGLAPHSDYGFLTILLQSSPGLEVMPHDDNTWTPVPAIPGALHVHIGDHLEVLSNGQIKSLVHRAVLNPEEARISIASIHSLSKNEKVSCAKELVDEENPEMYRESSFQDFLDFLPLLPARRGEAGGGGVEVSADQMPRAAAASPPSNPPRLDQDPPFYTRPPGVLGPWQTGGRRLPPGRGAEQGQGRALALESGRRTLSREKKSGTG